MNTKSAAGSGTCELKHAEPAAFEFKDNSGEYLGRALVSLGFMFFWLVFVVNTLVMHMLIGPGWFNFYMSPILGLMYWVDIFPHFLAGVSIAFFFMACKVLFAGLDLKFNLVLCFQGILFSFVIGGLWEWYEIVSGLAQCEIDCHEIVFGLSFLHFNQAKDVLMDCSGTFVVLYGLVTLFSRK